jgi:hypothetical protein
MIEIDFLEFFRACHSGYPSVVRWNEEVLEGNLGCMRQQLYAQMLGWA